MTRRSLVFAAAFAGLLLGPPRPAAAVVLPDSTAADAWRLENGLEVRVRHVPGAAGIVITTGYRSGLLDDPAGREGLAELLTELQFFSATGEIPERTREEMESLRPLGWKASTTKRVTLMTEVATLQQFPGALRQIATRMRGVTLTPAALASAVAGVRRELGSRTFGQPDQALYWRVHALASGLSDEALLARASARGLAGVKLDEASALLRERFAPANGCLALAGDFSNLNLRTLIEQEFGAIPAGRSREIAQEPALRGGERASVWPGLPQPLGVLGIVAPALDDSLHPQFYLAGLVMGLELRRKAGAPPAPLSARFQFSPYEDPELLRLYPDVPATDATPAALGTALDDLIESLGRQIVSLEALNSVKRGWDWLLGGPLPQGLRRQSASAPGMLTPLATGMATRALWRGDAFWDRYRVSFEQSAVTPTAFFNWVLDPAHQARLVLKPKK